MVGGLGMELAREKLEQYLSARFAQPASIVGLAPLGQAPSDASGKFYGYGVPLRVDYRLAGGEIHSAVLHTMGAGPFGHEHVADRAQVLLWAHDAFGSLPRHVRSLDVGGFQRDGTLRSFGDVEEVFQLTEFAEGKLYSNDLKRLQQTGTFDALDLSRCDALCDYLVQIHEVAGGSAGLYVRRIRELMGHGECIMGIADSYPPSPMFPASLLEEVEHRCVKWRWRLKALTHRCRQVHGDFHPWNILFRESTDFTLLDRSRGEWGDPADDVTSITANYLFFSLRRSGRLEGIFETLFIRFWEHYMRRSGDQELLQVVAPFFAFRGLVLASPLWYPDLPDSVRRKLISFVLAVLERDRFSPYEVNAYCEALAK